jgi:hypothetical protein
VVVSWKVIKTVVKRKGTLSPKYVHLLLFKYTFHIFQFVQYIMQQCGMFHMINKMKLKCTWKALQDSSSKNHLNNNDN